ncbi:MAG TPA: S-layer homology domain-containing protein, partial [Chloroflexia bacterium]|nr:S-layer homology domain-containing protein [Chloroflexia bacterium]
GQLAEYKFHVDWTNPALSTFTGPILIPVADFAYPPPRIPQPGTTVTLDNLSDRLMYRLAYRNLGTHEALVVNHTVNAGGLDAPRWYELRDPNNPTGATVFQQGTYAPADGIHRWMGSIAMDRAGNIALGFSAASSTLFPSIRYAGRLVTDPLGQLSQGEATLITGTGSETHPAGRWGDYSDLTVDPTDDCTFWFTTEYFARTGLRNWRTRIGSFKFPQCTAQGTPTPVASATGAVPSATRTPGPSPTFCPGAITATGSITNTDPTQSGRLALGDPKSNCLAPQPLPPAESPPSVRHYDTYTYTNSSGAPQCVTVNITQNCGDNAVQSAAYLGTFDPNNVTANYLAHGGASGHTFGYSFSLGSAQSAVVVVWEVSPDLGCTTYNISINPCAPPVQATPSQTPNVTATRTPVVTPSATPTTVCVGTTYQAFASAGATMLPATNDINNHCDDCTTAVNLPFPVNVYGTAYTSANVGSNGMVQFASNNPNIYTANCLPVRSNAPNFNTVLFAYYDDLRTDVLTPTHGIFTGTVGVAPNRDFVIRWNATYFASDTDDAQFEVVLHESSDVLTVIYGNTSQDPAIANPGAGIQLNLGQYTSYVCHTPIPDGTIVNYVPIGCGITPTATPAPPTATASPTPPGVCAMPFTDVDQYNPFYVYIRCLYCRGIVSGYADNTFRPYNNVTRGQATKIVVLAAGFPLINPGTPTYTDVPANSAFYTYIETASARGIVSGYNNTPPCTTGVPCFRPYADVTRGQLAKIDSNAAGYNDDPAGVVSFADVPVSNPFYLYVHRLARRGIISGYDCGSTAINPCTGLLETCGPERLPYFRPCANITRGQTAKIVANTFFPTNCAPGPARR